MDTTANSNTFPTLNGIPGLHAEVQAANSALNRFTSVNVNDIQLSTFNLSPGNGQGLQFPACTNCGGILNSFEILTGRK